MVLKVGTIKVERGHKGTGYLLAGETPLGKVEIPITVINGIEPGPKLAMTGGFHPREAANFQFGIVEARVMVDQSPPVQCIDDSDGKERDMKTIVS